MHPAKASAPSLHPSSWLAAGLPAIKAIEGLAAVARAAGDISQSAAIASVAASLKCLIGSARAVLQASCDDPEWHARAAVANSILHARYLAGQAGQSTRASDCASPDEVATRNLAEHNFAVSIATLRPGQAASRQRGRRKRGDHGRAAFQHQQVAQEVQVPVPLYHEEVVPVPKVMQQESVQQQLGEQAAQDHIEDSGRGLRDRIACMPPGVGAGSVSDAIDDDDRAASPATIASGRGSWRGLRIAELLGLFFEKEGRPKTQQQISKILQTYSGGEALMVQQLRDEFGPRHEFDLMAATLTG